MNGYKLTVLFQMFCKSDEGYKLNILFQIFFVSDEWILVECFISDSLWIFWMDISRMFYFRISMNLMVGYQLNVLFQIVFVSDEWILVECSISDFLFYVRFSEE